MFLFLKENKIRTLFYKKTDVLYRSEEGKIIHLRSMATHRRLRGPERDETAKELENKTPFEVFLEKKSKLSLTDFNRGKMGDARTLKVYQKLKEKVCHNRKPV